MRIPRYWAKGTETVLTRNPKTGKPMQSSFWGWSDVSLSEAIERGNQRAKAIAEMWRKGDFQRDRYSYGDQPLHEDLLDEWKNDAGETWVAVTRNVYGCEVLNTAAIMFVDVDLPGASTGETLARAFRGLFGKAGPSRVDREQGALLGKLRAMVAEDPGRGVRVYRTRGGLRCLMTQSRMDPGSEAALKSMEALGADPLYVKLCRTQGCFRARLTPKPWRCKMPPLRIRYPWPDDAAAQKVKTWCAEYSRKAQGFATCELIEHLGNPAMDAEIARVVEFHDRATRVGSNLELA